MNDEEVKNEAEELEDIFYADSTEDGDELPTKDIVKKLREDLKQARSEKEEYLTGWQRAKADYVNLQKEIEQMRLTGSTIAKEKFLKNLLPTLDSFDMAFSNKEAWEKVDAGWRTGIEYIHQQFMNSLAESGVEKIDKTGIPFDPNLHESMETVPTDDESKNHLVEKVIQVGYKIGDRVTRPARVNVFEYKKA